MNGKPPAPHIGTFLDRLRRRHIVRWTIAYVAGAWVLLQAAELLFGIFGWGPGWLRVLTVSLVFGFFATIVLAWFHGEKGQQRVSGLELVLLVLVLIGAVVTLTNLNPLSTDDADERIAENPFVDRPNRRATANDFYEADPSWAPDSQSFVFVSERSGNRDLWLLDRAGSMSQLTSHGAEENQPAWSPAGNSILFVSSRDHGEQLDRSVFYGYTFGGDIYSIPAFGGTAVKLVDNGHNPSWSPDGRRFVFDSTRDGSRRIWIANADGTVGTKVSSDDSDLASHIRPAWSTDGRWIVYERQPGSQASAAALVVVSADGDTQFRLTDGKFRDMSPAWTDNDSIVFASDRGGALNLWQADIDFSRQRMRGKPAQITRGAGEDFDPAIAPDGTLVYSSLRRLRNLWQVSVDPETLQFGSDPERILDSSWNDFAPAVRSDDGALAFSSDRGGAINVWVLDDLKSDPRQLTSRSGRDLQPVWSPDGTMLAFFSDQRGDNDIWIMPLNGGPPVVVTPGEYNDINPYWSSDGRELAFMSDRNGESDVWRMKVDGRDAMRLSDIGALGHTARWSPDDRWLLFTSTASGNRDIWAVDRNGTEIRQITTEPSQDAHGLWSADGREVLYLADHRKIYAKRFDALDDRRLLFDLGETIDYVHLSPDGKRFLFTREKVQSDLWLIE